MIVAGRTLDGSPVEDTDNNAGDRSDGLQPEDIPTVYFQRSLAPTIEQNFNNAVAGGAPLQLTRMEGKAKIEQNRYQAKKGLGGASAGPRMQWDEYPFASTYEGGYGAYMMAVPQKENQYQGQILSKFYRDSGIRDGGRFNVRFIP